MPDTSKKRVFWAIYGAIIRKHVRELQADGYPLRQAKAIAIHAARGGAPNSKYTQRLKARVKNFKVPQALKRFFKKKKKKTRKNNNA